MLVSQNSPHAASRLTAPSIARAVIVALPVLTLVLTGCNRDELAPDCFKIDPDTGVCLIPDPGGTEPGINCGTMPDGALGATYSFTPEVGGGSGNFNMWMATGLPPGLSIDANTGEISGVPTEPMAYSGIEISMFDVGKGESFETQCGELVINPALNANAVLMEPTHCIDISASYDDMLALLGGGDGTEITCSALANNAGSESCPLGDGNGRMAPGISFNESSCTHSGSITGDRRGTWVWMVELVQSGYTTRVPFCASNDVDTFHDITVVANAVSESDLTPGLFEYNPNASLAFGDGSYKWAIDDPACPGTDCSTYGFRFNVTCSPFDLAPDPNDPNSDWHVTLDPSGPSETGMTHEMSASGPAPDPKFDGRPFVASFEISYCTSGTPGFCDTTDATQFEQNAQTRYHFDVVGFPTLAP